MSNLASLAVALVLVVDVAHWPRSLLLSSSSSSSLTGRAHWPRSLLLSSSSSSSLTGLARCCSRRRRRRRRSLVSVSSSLAGWLAVCCCRRSLHRRHQWDSDDGEPVVDAADALVAVSVLVGSFVAVVLFFGFFKTPLIACCLSCIAVASAPE